MTEATRYRLRSRLRNGVWAVHDLLARPTATWRSLPDYLVIGAQRCGTTSLQRLLSTCDSIAPPFLRKGVHFFDTDFQRGVEWYKSHFPMDTLRGDRLSGEASPYYLFHPAAASRIREVAPDVRMIVLLRDPVERAISHHKHEVRRGFETLDLDEAIDAETARLHGETERLLTDPGYRSFAHQHFSYVARGRYAEQLARYFDYFPRASLLVLESETFWEQPDKTIAAVASFLGVDLDLSTLPHRNATRPTNVTEATRKKLTDLFADANRDLTALLGRGFRWTT